MGIIVPVIQEAGIEFVEKTSLNKTHNGLTRLYIYFFIHEGGETIGIICVTYTCMRYLSALSTVAGLKVSLSTLIRNAGKSPSS